jgi:hypothetical protein
MGQRDVVLHHLVLREQLAMRPSRHGTLAHDVKRSLRLTEPTHGVVDTAPAEALLSQDEPIAWRTNQMVGRNTAAPKHELGMVPDLTEFDLRVGHRPDVAHDFHARRSDGNYEDRRVPVRSPFGVRLGEHQDDVGD